MRRPCARLASRGAAVVVAALALGTPALLRAQGIAVPTADTSVHLTFGGFVDSYYAWDFGRPPSFDRSFAGGALFTTQPARHDEFNVNLAYVEAKLAAPRCRGRLALQAGTSVQSNYSGEPTRGRISGPSLAQLLQEAYAGTALADDLWVDAGVFFSHMGMEGWISRDNPTYTRSLVADYSPYYQSGARLTWTPTAQLTAQLDVVNGWQIISENNSGKGAGVRLDWAPASAVTVSYYDFFSDEAGTRLRTFNGVGAKATVGRWTLLGELDLGTQKRPRAAGGTSTWSGWAAVARARVAPAVALTGRVEGYDDEDQVIVATGAFAAGGRPVVPNPPLHAVGGSVGVDVARGARLLWRTELRGWRNRGALFPDGADGAPRKATGFVVTALALTI